MKKICILDLPSFGESYGKKALQEIIELVESLKDLGFSGIYLKDLWEDNCGQDIVINQNFLSTGLEFIELVVKVHVLDMILGVDVSGTQDKDTLTEVFIKLSDIGIDFAKVNCMIPSKDDISAIQDIREAAFGMTLFFDWFGSEDPDILGDKPECWALDHLYAFHQQWHHPKLVPLLCGGGTDAEVAKRKMDELPVEYGFLDIPTLIGWSDKNTRGIKPVLDAIF